MMEHVATRKTIHPSLETLPQDSHGSLLDWEGWGAVRDTTEPDCRVVICCADHESDILSSRTGHDGLGGVGKRVHGR